MPLLVEGLVICIYFGFFDNNVKIKLKFQEGNNSMNRENILAKYKFGGLYEG